jgi:cytochrome oxidase Cu insertion factor (SCO1/SenC/PrrC family)
VGPSSDTPIANLGPRLDALLLHSLLWLLLAGCAVGTAWWLARGTLWVERLRVVLLGQPAAVEPAARRFLRLSFGLLWIVDGLLQAQSAMPTSFSRVTLSAGLADSPRWLADLVGPLVRTWIRHPVLADATTVWVQVGLGVLFLIGGSGLLLRLALWGSVAWGAVVWVAGEFLGGLLSPGASWLMGAPGAVLVYVVSALVLMAPWQWWATDRSELLVRRAVGSWLLVGAFLQALPWENSWSGNGFSAPFADAAAVRQPAVFRRPIAEIATSVALHPIVANAIVVALLTVVGVGLWLSRRTLFVVAGLVLCAATWWLAQDFGVLGGAATDPNTALPLGLLLACALPYWREKTATRRFALSPDTADRFLGVRRAAAAGLSTVALGALVVAPLAVVGPLLGPADAAALAADSGGGIVSVPHRPAPEFALTDQTGRPISLASLRGKLTLVTFFDPVCSDDCPLIANQLAIADRQLGADAGKVEIVAIDSNPTFHNVADVAAFTTSHGLADLPNWHFLAGPPADLQDVIAAYGIVIQVPTVGMIEHGEGIFFIGTDGTQRAYLGDGADVVLTQGYASAVRDEIRRLLA